MKLPPTVSLYLSPLMLVLIGCSSIITFITSWVVTRSVMQPLISKLSTWVMAGVPWSQTSWRYLSPKYMPEYHLTHHALQDALDQAEIFKKMLEEIQINSKIKGELQK